MNNKPVVLVILDGFGYKEEQTYNAIAQADAPTINYFLNTYPHTLLAASGVDVGLPDQVIGNSEVGHLTIGAGRIIKQAVVRLNEFINSGNLFKDAAIDSMLAAVDTNHKTVHLCGLLSDANVHSNQDHLHAMLEVLKEKGVTRVIVHAILDGRDTPPRSAERYLKKLEQKMKALEIGILGTIHGRFYAMDRNNNWDRTQQSYTLLTENKPAAFSSWQEAIAHYYKKLITDEFIPPTSLCDDGAIADKDLVIFFNFRPDRTRQLAYAFKGVEWNAFKRAPLDLEGFITPVAYDCQESLPVYTLLPFIPIKNTLKEVLNEQGKTLFSIGESEKYAHITYFFNGENEALLPLEERVLIPSLRVKTYSNKPEMSAPLITDAVLNSLAHNPKDFYLINYANADMVGHSGNMEATIQAIECLDEQLERLYKYLTTNSNATMYVTGDHGNAEHMFNAYEQQPDTGHTTNPVPFIYIANGVKGTNDDLPLKGLADIAPFILYNEHIPIPVEMIKKNDT